MTTRRLFLAVAAAALVLTALWLAAHDHDPDHAARTIVATAPETTTSSSSTTVLPTTSTLLPTTTTTRPPPPPTTIPVIVDAAFWARLGPGCESSTGTGGNGGGFFQFSPDTAKRVGYHAGLSYEDQRALAVKWLGMIGGRGGSRAGWPVCWWIAGGR
jgi:hypothetical protein